MQVHGDFVFHLEDPRERFDSGPECVRGWIASQEEVREVRLRGATERILELQERPDVRRAFPNYPFAVGFIGEVDARDVCEGALHFVFGSRSVAETLALPPGRPSSLRLALLKLRLGFARRVLQAAQTAQARWKAAVQTFLIELEMARGRDFRRGEADRLIALFAEHFPEAFVVQIGANDGAAGDPLADAFRRTKWSGLLVEPVPHLAERLAARYADRKDVRVVQAAISVRDGETSLYRLRTIPGQTPEWHDHLATLDREVLLKQRGAIPNIDALIIQERVPTLRLETLLAEEAVTRVDLLVIDTEGHDFEILRAFDFDRYQPLLLMFEHQHLRAEEKAAAYAVLHARSYSWREMSEGDAIAWRQF